MNVIKKMLLLLVISGMLHSIQALGSETLAVVLKTNGSVTVTGTGQSEAIQINRGYRLVDGDKLITREKSFAALRFIDDASLVRLRPNSVCIISGQKEQGGILKNITLEVGAILSDIPNLKGEFRVATPTSVASVKGTRFITDHHTTGGTFYYSEEDTLCVNNFADSLCVGPGWTVFVSSKSDSLQAWQTQSGEKPDFGDDGVEDVFEIEFEDESGKKKTLQFKVLKKD